MLRKYFSISLFLTALPLLTAPALYGQTTSAAPVWTMITAESSTVAVTLPTGTTYRLGDTVNNRWSASITVNQPTTINPVSMAGNNPFPFSDPDPGTAKELDVQETQVAQMIAVTNLAASPTTTVSQAVPPLAPPTTVPVLPGTAYTLTFSNFSIAPGTAQNALMFAFANQPASQATRTWEGTQMNMTIDGVTMVCTYGQTYTDGVFSLNCAVPGAPAPTS
jgi:hypothetical protein